MEIFPIEEMQKSLGLDKLIYNRGIQKNDNRGSAYVDGSLHF